MNRLFAQNDDAQRVRDASDIVRVVGEHISLRPRGREFVGLCPFHDDTKPSMCVVPHKQIFHCFACGAGGDVFSFVQKYHQMGFREALEYLAERSGVELAPARRIETEVVGGESGTTITRQSLVQANQFAAQYFQAILNNPVHGEQARERIQNRGIHQKMVEQFQIGASPSGEHQWDGLIRSIQAKGLAIEPFVALGLVKAREQSDGFYDAMRHRLIFPIMDRSGRVIAFGGRRIDDEDEPKYLNSPESMLFSKSATLFGMHQAARAIQSTGTAVVTEGYTDVIACHQAGLTNAVATLGTALTRGHARELRFLCHDVVLLFDGDEAGQKAADRAIEVFFAEDLDVRLATLSSVTDAKDPDELLKREGGKELLHNVIEEACDLLRYRFRSLKARLVDAGPGATAAAIRQECATLVGLGLDTINPSKRQLILRQLAECIRDEVDGSFQPRALSQLLDEARARTRSRSHVDQQVEMTSSPGAIGTGKMDVADHVLGCLLCEPRLVLCLDEAERDLIGPDAYAQGLQAQVSQAVFDAVASDVQAGLSAVLDRMEELEARSIAVSFQQHIERLTDADPTRLREHFTACIATAFREKTNKDNTDGSNEVSDLIARLNNQRDKHAQLGPDLRRVPRPGMS